MALDDRWKRLAALTQDKEGNIAVVWGARNPDDDVLHLYDCCTFQREVMPVVIDGLTARGRWLPLAWAKQDEALVKMLLERGIRAAPEPAVDSDESMRLAGLDLWTRMRTGRLKVDQRLGDWLQAWKEARQDAGIEDSPLLMRATQILVAGQQFARPVTRSDPIKIQRQKKPRLSIV